MSVDPRRTQPFCDPRCYRECRCSRWPDYKNRFGEYVVPHPEDTWTPADPLPGSGLLPEHWYRSDGPLWQDAGITPAVLDGAVVGRWEDIAWPHDHVNQAVVANKPTLQNGAGDLLNGQPVIRFDGTNDYLRGAFTTGGLMIQPNTWFAVVKIAAAAVNDGTSDTIFDSDDGLNRNLLSKWGTPVPDAWSIYAGTATIQGTPATSEWLIFTCLYNGATSQFWKDGISENIGNAGAGGIDGLTVGATFSSSNFWTGDMVEILGYDANLSDADKNEVGQYLADRYALAYTDI